MKRESFFLPLTLALVISLIPLTKVSADVAPPQMPPGANINPNAEGTQVRMVAETVILDVRQDPNQEAGAIANTTAVFTMRNLGTTEETMQARFPLSFSGGDSDGFGNFPEINQISIRVNGRSVNANRQMQPALVTGGYSYQERDQVPWAVFDVTFPPAQDVTIEVAYTVSGFGYYPYEVFRYILETGAGWKDTIGSADIIVRLPYEASKYNVWLPDETTGYSQTSPGAMLDGNEVRWHFENLEPTAESNIEISLVTPALWQRVVNETDAVARNPSDGEAWGRLGKAYKQIAIMSKGYPRADTDGQEVFALSRQAYEKCLSLLPNDALWQYGYADLLWPHYYFNLYMQGKPDEEGLLPRLLTALKTSQELEPDYQPAKDLLSWIFTSIPGVLDREDGVFDYLALTATPLPPTPYPSLTESPTATPTTQSTSLPTALSTEANPIPTRQPSRSPICGGAAILLPLLVGVFWRKRGMTA